MPKTLLLGVSTQFFSKTWRHGKFLIRVQCTKCLQKHREPSYYQKFKFAGLCYKRTLNTFFEPLNWNISSHCVEEYTVVYDVMYVFVLSLLCDVIEKNMKKKKNEIITTLTDWLTFYLFSLFWIHLLLRPFQYRNL